jgi:hypothetical protein
VVQDTIDLVCAVVNSTAASVMSGLGYKEAVQTSVSGNMGEWMKGILGKEWRINCFDVAIRL